MLIGLIAGLFLLSAIPFISAQDSIEPTLLEIQINEADLNQWYFEGDTLSFNSSLVNNGEETTIVNDPSCGVFLSVVNFNSETIYDNSNLCRGQTRDLTLVSNENFQFSEMSWNFTNYDRNLISSGWYSISSIHSTTNLKTTKDIYYQNNIEFNSNLELELNQVNFGESNDDSGHYLVGITLSNPTDSSIELPNEESCKMIYSINQEDSVIDSCYGDNSLLHAYEKSYLGGIFIPRNSLTNGSNEIIVSTPGNSLIQKIVIQHELSQDDNIKLLADGVDVSISKGLEMEREHISFLSYSISLENSKEESVSIDFSSTCKFQMFIIDDLGQEIVNTSSNQICQDVQTSHSLNSGDELVFDLPNWYLEDVSLCSIDSGTYTVIIEIYEYSTIMVDHYQHNDNHRNIECTEGDVGFESDYTLVGENIFSSVIIYPTEQIIKINEPCIIGFLLQPIGNTIQYNDSILEVCDFKTGNYLDLPATEDGIQQELRFENQLSVSQVFDVNNTSIDISFIVEHTLQSGGIAYHNFTYSSINDEIITPKLVWELEGLWTNIGTDGIDCWMLSNDENSVLLVNSELLPSWEPKNNWEGEYLVSESSVGNEQCQFKLQEIEIISIYSEQKISLSSDIKQSESEDDVLIKTPTPEFTKVAIVVVSTSSVFAILGLFVINTESLRIPTTAAGLWLLGMLGKTQETSDGRFQRGRLMGYLTANPGCHFRALMAALKMSNGQITHHLRLLENQELIWRLKDGRLVRYYPLNNSLYPGMTPDELPIPLLSPDPNSLQGKILSLLDDEHQYGKFPTQAELAIKLEKSQQLISHHLRTLQKFGLVEKRKMGIKNRYKLTKEALFLLETDIDFNVKE